MAYTNILILRSERSERLEGRTDSIQAGNALVHLDSNVFIYRLDNLIVWNRVVDRRTATRGILHETAEPRRVSPRELPDAIHIVAAMQSGCAFFMSGDRGTRKLPIGMKRPNTNRAGIRESIDLPNV